MGWGWVCHRCEKPHFRRSMHFVLWQYWQTGWVHFVSRNKMRGTIRSRKRLFLIAILSTTTVPRWHKSCCCPPTNSCEDGWRLLLFLLLWCIHHFLSHVKAPCCTVLCFVARWKRVLLYRVVSFLHHFLSRRETFPHCTNFPSRLPRIFCFSKSRSGWCVHSGIPRRKQHIESPSHISTWEKMGCLLF